ncbi:MAG: hypothetical protein ABW221_06420 [Vicinamibacteria bacterium]
MHNVLSIVVAAGLAVAGTEPPGYPPIGAYLMDRAAEVALARSAAPPTLSARATVKVLTASGYAVVEAGDNGSVCLVMRGFTAPTYTPREFRGIVYDPKVHAPICFTPDAARDVLPYYELRTALAMEGKGPDAIASGVEAAYAQGRLPRRDRVTFAYMFSAHQHLGPGIDAWRPHMMVFAPYYTNAMLGENSFGGPWPQLSDDAGTPFSVVVIPVDPALAIAPPVR